MPYFDPQRGSFLGYRGTARRPRVDEIAYNLTRPAGVFGTQFPADSLRQLIHELRTPLNAIIGFAEMIEGQYMGPAAAGYRGSAAEIMAQARGLLGAVDDLDTAARLETQPLRGRGEPGRRGRPAVPAARIYERVAAQRGATIAIEIGEDLPPALVEPGAAERMFARLLAGDDRAGGRRRDDPGGDEPGGARRGGDALPCRRPARGDPGCEEADLLDPGYSPDGDWPGAPALGLGFALQADPQPRRGGRRGAGRRGGALRSLPSGRRRGHRRARRKRQPRLKPAPGHAMRAEGL